MDPTTLLRRIGAELRCLRHSRGYSQESFADAIKMHRAYYSAIERGEKNLQISTLLRVCTGLDVSLHAVLRAAETP